MDWNEIQRSWPEYCGKVRERWSELTSSEVEAIAGRRDQLLRELQIKYGLSQEQAEKEIVQFSRRCKWGLERFEHCIESLFSTSA